MKDAARLAKAESALIKELGRLGLNGKPVLRQMDGNITASIILEGGAPGQDLRKAEETLKDASGVSRVVLVETEHGGGPTLAETPPRPPSSGGHGDPLHLGKAPARRSGPSYPKGVGAVIAVTSGKGGVGKSTVAAGLALSLSRQGRKVGLLDLDIHGPSLPVLFPAEERLRSENGAILPIEREGLQLVSIGYMVDERKAVAWRGPMVMNAARQLIDDTAWGDLDVLIVDTPPGTGDAHISMVQRLKIDAAILVATPSPLAAADVRRGAALFATTGTKLLGIVVNMDAGPLGSGLSPELVSDIGARVLDTVPFGAEAAKLPLTRQDGIALPGTLSAAEALIGAEPRDSSDPTL
jgi:ATP-binding protein involved in chromosome partitioning